MLSYLIPQIKFSFTLQKLIQIIDEMVKKKIKNTYVSDMFYWYRSFHLYLISDKY